MSGVAENVTIPVISVSFDFLDHVLEYPDPFLVDAPAQSGWDERYSKHVLSSFSAKVIICHQIL